MRRSTISVLMAGAVSGALLVLPTPTVSAASFDAVQDTYVDESSPTRIYGSREYLKVDGSPVLKGFVQFDVQSGDLGSAVLQFYALSSSSRGLDVVTVADNTWSESTMNANNDPALGTTVASTGAFKSDSWVSVNVSDAVSANGLLTLGLRSSHSTSMKIASSESATPPRLIVPAPTSDTPFVVSPAGTGYRAENAGTGTVYTGSLKSVVERSVDDLKLFGGGTVQFTAGDFNLGSEWFEFYDVTNVEFVGAGMGSTVLRNETSASTDTEPFDFSGAYGVQVRNLTVSAGGALRTTSDALDFDQGNDVVVENVEVVKSRGRGIVFDGKNDNWQSAGNRIVGCVITGVPSDGIELLASTDNVVEGCTITNVGGHGIQLAKSSLSADQPNKLPSRNTIRNNTVDQSGQDGINVNGGNDNLFVDNTITNSSDETTSRDGIRLGSGDGAACNDNQVRSNIATDNQATKTQRYGLYIATSLCNRTVVGADNDFSGNRVAPYRDLGTATVFE
jgi:parallel beta-helix repeat protein